MSESTRLERILLEHDEELSSRNNNPRQYLPLIQEHLLCIENGTLDKVPAPLCVQLQVSSKCSTFCKMCDHYKDKANGLSFEQWCAILTDLFDFGVRSVIFSGGEPLARTDIADLLKFAKAKGFAIGLLTNATMECDQAERYKIIDTIAECVDWIAISIDGTPETETNSKIRIQPAKGGEVISRVDLLTEFCSHLQIKKTSFSSAGLSATVTLQRGNADMDIQCACDFIHKKIGIPKVNFKLVTGATETLSPLAHAREYLLTQEQLQSVVEFLWENHLPQEKDHRGIAKNNLAYLRRSFAEGVFTESDAVNGEPVKSFYRGNELRCYTPLLFSLIHSDGKVYPCCHLYRDNHGNDEKSKKYRDLHNLGNVTEKPFSQIWNDTLYVRERENLARIDPEFNFSPCGECTRHCRHNAVLSAVQKEFKGQMNELKAQALALEQPKPGTPVWF